MKTKLRMKNVLVTLAVFAVFGTFSGSPEPVIPLLRGTLMEPVLRALHNGNSIVFNLSIGYLVSLLFWYLIVYLPEQKVRRILRNNLALHYRNFKEDVIQTLLWASGGIHDSQLPKELSNHVKFKEYFGNDNRQRWYDVLNHLQSNPDRLSDLVLELQLLSDEVAYVLSKVNFDDPDVHAFFRRLCLHVHRLQRSSVYSHDQVKYFGNYLWSILAAWSFVEGQRQDDIIQKMIEKI